jgi:hypothetical protein
MSMYQPQSCVVLLFNLLQDVNLLWPIAKLVHQETSYPLILLVSGNFVERDHDGQWMAELQALQSDTAASLHIFPTTLGAYDILQNRKGIIIAASESSLNPHRATHDLFRGAPAGFTRVTLQHGFECAGFHHNREQSLAFGDSVHFAADVLCSWTASDKLTHMARSEIGKVVVTGPSSRIIGRSPTEEGLATTNTTGLVCENLHSVRMSAAGDFKQSYMDTFLAFTQVMAHKGRTVALRPHPGGQYVIRKAVQLPENMVLQNEPMYRVDLSRYAYGISAPSSVLIDMALAGIPTAVWQDPDGTIDTRSYEGLTKIQSLREWIAFADAAVADPSSFVEKQNEFIRASGILIDAGTVHDRFLDLIRAACGGGAGAHPRSASKRVLFVANGEIPTLEICFLRPLRALVESGALDPLLIVEGQIRKVLGSDFNTERAERWLTEQIETHQPDVAVFCRYSGPLAGFFVDALHDRNIPVIYHVDDDLMNVPTEIGDVKFREHNSPDRLMSVSALLATSDLVYCSTPRLLQRIDELGYDNNLRTGSNHCSGEIHREPVERPVRTIGYMGFDHAHDLEMILPDLLRLLRDRPEIRFELFGTIPVPEPLFEFGDRVSIILPVRPYEAFLDKLVSLDWDIGIAPLANTQFNYYKANNKWVEYTSAGYAVVATAGMSYDHCCADDCGILVSEATGWYEALTSLCDDPALRCEIVRNAQGRLVAEYSKDALRRQVLAMFDEAQAIRMSKASVAPSCSSPCNRSGLVT